MARADHMTAAQTRSMSDKGKPTVRTHENCRERTGVNRPGKTASDRANRGERVRG